MLTPEGQIVATAARDIAASTEKMHELLQEGRALDETCHVGLIDSVAYLLYSSDNTRSLLADLEVIVDNSRLILHDLSEGKIDLGVITGQPEAFGRGLVFRKLCNEEFIFVTAPSRAPATPTDQVDDWLATNQDSTTYQHFLRMFKRKHLQVTPIFHSTSMELLRDMAVSGKGTALLPRHIAQPLIDAGALAPVETKPLYRPIWAVTRRGKDSLAITPLLTWLNTLLSGA
jgi:DNA-binding transcriptional LysR family regulator